MELVQESINRGMRGKTKTNTPKKTTMIYVQNEILLIYEELNVLYRKIIGIGGYYVK